MPPPGSTDFPASSFFDMFVQVDLPACGTLPASTVQNNPPLIVKNNNLTSFPPKVIYLHDQSSSVPVVFVGGLWAGQTLGYLVLAGHGAGFSCLQSDLDDFNNFMASQPVSTCPGSSCAPTSSSATFLRRTEAGARLQVWACTGLHQKPVPI